MGSDTQRIALGLRQRDAAVLETLVEQYQSRLVRYLVSLLGRRDGVDDLLQEKQWQVFEGMTLSGKPEPLRVSKEFVTLPAERLACATSALLSLWMGLLGSCSCSASRTGKRRDGWHFLSKE